MRYQKRQLEKVLKDYIKRFSCIAVTGPRQSGKSTLLTHLFSNYRYISFDDISMRSFFQDDPKRFMSVYNDKVIFDEIQKVPEIFDYIKLEIDKDRSNKGKFILSGSSQLMLMNTISESLAGRVGIFTLLPFQYTEMPEKFRQKSVFQGAYPELTEWAYENTQTWYDAYVRTYLEKDVRSLYNIGNLQDFRRLLQLLAGLTAQELNYSVLSNKIGVSIPTIKNWISILEASYILFLLPSYHLNIGKRVNKRPRIHFYDMGLVSFLTGITTFEQYDMGPMSGSMYESYVVSEIVKQAYHSNSMQRFSYLRTNHGDEVDLVIEDQDETTFVEIKKNATFKTTMLSKVEKLKPEKAKGLLLYQGENLAYTESIEVKNTLDFLNSF